mmetsp:Transcript_6289/g.20028  ORF Transcript_6289/g.20028 Transcript_6289/m.20028 type:complete len:313 (-) Transcript_6289:33-971(-)|eukprot:CAMPEP_0196780918 /NCGR_PEP_ID=MMETSP1104-20130614/8813_1 /TAXON_ID=33652 /ORGANISM="Cafeteria sp., Strain Caron Lab Isolate" /LENGTH=312 /DNA_ID=CAMNT_0042151135 /DNA_START=52 /DNA_END=990 /DNA_ORIENTATION=-
MGCRGSKSSYVSVTGVDERVVSRLRQLRNERFSGESVPKSGGSNRRFTHFNRIILKFNTIRDAFLEIRKVFNATDEDRSGTIEYDELQAVMKRLGAECSDQDVREIFQESSLYSDNKLTFREFLVSLALGYVLNIIPGLRHGGRGPSREVVEGAEQVAEQGVEETKGDDNGEGGDEGGGEDGAPEGMRRDSALFGKGAMFANAFQLVVEAYMLFDTDASGTIDRDEVINVLCKSEGSQRSRQRSSPATTGASALLSEDRWRELDADNDGFITFSEFLYGFATWVGMDEDEEEDEEEAAGEAGSASAGAAAAQ